MSVPDWGRSDVTDKLSIFISSPGDVGDERRRAAIVIGRIRREFSRFFDVSPILWEYDPMLASGHFQDIIEKPSNTDIVVLILWSRLGTALPTDRYQGIDGRTPVTGTEWEFEDALAGNRAHGSPDLLVYRKTSPAQAAFSDPVQLERAQHQWEAVQTFWLRHFVDKDGVFKAAFNHFAELNEFEAQLEMHLRALLRERVSKRLRAEGGRSISWHSGSPFRGLSVFDPEHAAIFFGREKAEQDLVEALARRAEAGGAFVLVLGSSGSGKSSLLRAGVLPTVETPGVVEGVARWRRLIFTPAELGADPFAGLAERLLGEHVLFEGAAAGDVAFWRSLLRNDPAGAAARIDETLDRAADALGLKGGERPLHLFVLVDQLEEVFTAPGFDAATREAFAALLAALASVRGVWIAASMRADFFPRLTEVETLATLAAGEGAYALAAPRAPEIERMIQRPAEAAGVTFEVDPVTGIGLDGELLDAATRSVGALPLLEFTLDELYRRDVEGRGGDVLTFETYRALGGLEGAIAAQAEATVSALPEAVTAALPALVRALVTVGEDDRVGARAAPMAELSTNPDLAALTDALVAARLLVVSDDRSVKVAHEALLHAWPRAAALIAEDRDLLRARARAEAAMLRWRAEGAAEDYLLPRGRPLAEAAELLAARRDELSPDLVGFIEASTAADEARRQAELAVERARAEAEAAAERERAERAQEQAAAAQRLARRTRIAASVLGVLLVIAVGAGVYAFVQRQQAVAQRNAALESQSRFLADAASAAADSGDARLARLLALEALPKDLANPDRPYVASAEAALAQAWGEDRLIAIRNPAPRTPPPAATPAPKPGRFAKRAALLMDVAHHLDVLSFAFSGKGALITVAGQGHARVYDLDNNVLLDAPHAADKGAIAMDAAETQLAQGEGSGVRLWNIAGKTSRLLAGAGGADDATLKLAFSPDGSRLVASGAKGGVSIWSLPDGRLLGHPAGVTGPAYDVRVSPDSHRGVVVGADGRVGLYDLADGHLVADLGEAAQQAGDASARTLRQGVSFLAKFSADGALLATASDATHVRLWNAADGSPVGGPMAHDGPVQTFEFTDAGQRLEVSLLDGRTFVWAARAPGEARPVWAHAEAAFPSPDGRTVLITDAAGLHVVDDHGRLVRTLMPGPGLSVGTVSPDGQMAVVTVAGAAVALVPMAGGPPRVVYRAPAGQKVILADFTEAGGRLIVFMDGAPALMLDGASGRVIGPLGDGQQVLSFLSHSGQVAAFWRDGRTLIYGEDGRSHPLATLSGQSIMGFTGDAQAGLGASVGIGSATVFWDLASGKPVGKVDDGESLAATRAAFRVGPGGWIARGDVNQSILVWPWPAQGAPAISTAAVKRLLGHAGLIRKLRQTPDGRLVSEGQDNVTMVWDPLSGRRLARYEGVASSHLSQDGRRLVLMGVDGSVRLADLPPTGQALLTAERAHAGALTPAERGRYFLGGS